MANVKDMVMDVLELLESGLGVEDVAERMNLSPAIVQSIANDYGDFDTAWHLIGNLLLLYFTEKE